MLDLEGIAKNFAQQRDMPIVNRRRDFQSKKNRLSLVYFGRNHQRLILKKRFLPELDISESKLVYHNTGQDLHFSILYGCLHDYLNLLENNPDDFCQDFQGILLHHFNDLQDKVKPTHLVTDQVKSVEYQELVPLLNSLYPATKHI